MKLDRELQRAFLTRMAEVFPMHIGTEGFKELQSMAGNDEKLGANLRYLEMHGLMDQGSMRVTLDGKYMFNPGRMTITHLGLDFLADDGGLSAILGVVTVKLHADTVKDLIEAKIQSADLPESEKKTLIDHLRELPSEGLKHLTTRLVDSALDNLPAVLPLLRAQIGF